MAQGVRDKQNRKLYATVHIDWRGEQIYKSFSNDLEELISLAKADVSIIHIELAYSTEEPVWRRVND